MPMNNRLMRPRQSGITPLQVPGLQLWLDGSDASTITLNSTTVSEWRDKRSSGTRLASQPTAANQPDFRAAGTGINGRSTVFFKASSWMDTSGTAFSIVQPLTYFTVFRMPTAGVSGNVIDAVSGLRQIVNASAASGVCSVWAGTGFVNVTTGRAAQQVIAMIVVVNGASSQGAANTGTLATLASTPGSNDSPSQFKIGALINNTTSLEGDIAELCVFSGAMSAANARGLMNYARSKWGVVLV